MHDEIYHTARGNRYGLSRIGHKNGRWSYVHDCSKIVQPLNSCVPLCEARHKPRYSIMSMPTPNCICWIPPNLQAMEGIVNALRLRTCLTLFYALVDVVYKHKHSIVLCAHQHSVPILWNSPSASPTWSYSHQNIYLQAVFQVATNTSLANMERWNQCLQ